LPNFTNYPPAFQKWCERYDGTGVPLIHLSYVRTNCTAILNNLRDPNYENNFFHRLFDATTSAQWAANFYNSYADPQHINYMGMEHFDENMNIIDEFQFRPILFDINNARDKLYTYEYGVNWLNGTAVNYFPNGTFY